MSKGTPVPGICTAAIRHNDQRNNRHNTLRKQGRRLLPWALVIAAAGQQAAADNPTREARELAQRWLTLEQQRQQISTQWQREQQQLALRLDLLIRERDQLRSAISSHGGEEDAVTDARAELLARQQELEAEQAEITRLTRHLEDLSQALLPSLPPPLASRWRDSLASASDDNPSATLQRYLDLFGLLDDFHNVATLTEGLIDNPDGGQLHVQQLYLGASHAWYISADGSRLGSGRATTEGWVWEQDERLDPAQLRAAITQLERSGQGELVHLPVTLAPADGQRLAGVNHER
ncbi:DUF3450 family protein [Parahaliea mediterranea]|uniref:DUF3450 family protein n=1 Tax=Parahaliea mediterranea TaxID=651086 RepID=UPI000E2E4900|nr:DUF3450 family protein [Parahaliea mediterranea]